MKNKIILIIALLLVISIVSAHESEYHDQVYAGDLKMELTISPGEIPKTNQISIIGFEVLDKNDNPTTHTDGIMQITKEDKIIVSNYELHSHGNKFSTVRNFNEPGVYIIELKVKPSEHYEGTKFEPAIGKFILKVEENNNKNLMNKFILAPILAIPLIILVYAIRRRNVKNKSKS